MNIFRDLLSLHGYPTEPLFGRRYGQSYGNRVATARVLGQHRDAPAAPGPAAAEPEPAACAGCPA